jgi:signal recognition particle subunit SRP19
MKDEMKGERVLYPCYFNSMLKRSEGRRVPKSRAVRDPSLADIEKAARKCGIRFRVEQKSHPSYWWKREGRMVVTWGEAKEKLLKRISGCLEGKR